MAHTKEGNKKQLNNVTEETKDFLASQKRQMENSTSTLSETTKNISENINQYQRTNQYIIENSNDSSNKYQQETNKAIQSISNNFDEFQNNIFDNYRTAFTMFLDDSIRSYWNNFMIPHRYTEIFNNNNQNMIDSSINATRKSHELILVSTETFNKSMEISQNYFNESIQNYYNFITKLGRSFDH
jgi:hypothetical protein